MPNPPAPLRPSCSASRIDEGAAPSHVIYLQKLRRRIVLCRRAGSLTVLISTKSSISFRTLPAGHHDPDGLALSRLRVAVLSGPSGDTAPGHIARSAGVDGQRRARPNAFLPQLSNDVGSPLLHSSSRAAHSRAHTR